MRIANLTGIRAFAVLWVIVLHVNTRAAHGDGLGPLAKHGYLGVDIFFVLSGLVLSLVYVPRMPERFEWAWYRNYLSRRFAKIYPMHLLTFLAMVALVLAGHRLHYEFTATAENTPWSAFCQVSLLNAEGLTHELSWNTPAWSVGAEWFAYVTLFAPMVFLLRRVRLAWVGALCGAVWLGFLALCLHLRNGDLEMTVTGALRITPEFLGGYLLYRFLEERPTGGRALGCFLAGTAGLVTVAFAQNRANVLLLPAVLALLLGLYRGGGALDAVFGNPLALRVGEWSYSIYLTHLFVSIACFRVVAAAHLRYAGWTLAGIIVVIAALSIAFGAVCFRWVEEPLRLRLLRLLDARRRVPQAAGAEAGIQDTQEERRTG